METMGSSKPGGIEAQKTVQIEHLPGLDVIINLDYGDEADRDVILEILRDNPLGEKFSRGELFGKILSLRNNGDKRFYIKAKSSSTRQVNFIRKRMTEDYLSSNVLNDFDQKARYARAGTLSEITLSKKIKTIVDSTAVQNLVKKYGFAGMQFSEPILALTHQSSRRKYIIYRNISEDKSLSLPLIKKSLSHLKKNLSISLRNIFLENGINAHDLRETQFMITQQNGKPYIVLIDTEAYTKITSTA